MDKMRVVVSDEALRQMGNCVLFIAGENLEAAQRLRQRLVEAVRSLEEMPARYPFFNEPYVPANKYHKMFVEKYYLVLYQVKDDHVFVDMILDARQELPWLLR